MSEPIETFKISNEVIESGLAKTNLSAYESRVLWVIWRWTYGWRKLMDPISLGQFEKKTGLHKVHINKTLKKLIDRKIILRVDGYINIYGFNKNHDEWDKGLGKKGGGTYLGASTYKGWGVAPIWVSKVAPIKVPTKKRSITKKRKPSSNSGGDDPISRAMRKVKEKGDY